ncbi:MAG TPA: metalloregulator ArsR/SmtB family transcription factor [Bauldia sp.]|nr:metalloregulator ArsR/SmtB family transcription factor [Bauldia sp.]
MSDDDAHRAFKDRLYGQFARIGKALASPHRLEILELLAQGERTVESLAGEIGLSLANASQHLQGLREAGLVESRKAGLYVHYRLADDSVFGLSRALRLVAERRLAELDRLVRDHFGDRADPEPVGIEELIDRARSGRVVILDTRPASEYAAGHIAGALSVPVDEMKTRLAKLPKGKEYVAYCRGPYCIYADRAVELLRKSGRKARRLLDGYPEWKAAGLPIESFSAEGI